MMNLFDQRLGRPHDVSLPQPTIRGGLAEDRRKCLLKSSNGVRFTSEALEFPVSWSEHVGI